MHFVMTVSHKLCCHSSSCPCDVGRCSFNVSSLYDVIHLYKHNASEYNVHLSCELYCPARILSSAFNRGSYTCTSDAETVASPRLCVWAVTTVPVTSFDIILLSIFWWSRHTHSNEGIFCITWRQFIANRTNDGIFLRFDGKRHKILEITHARSSNL